MKKKDENLEKMKKYLPDNKSFPTKKITDKKLKGTIKRADKSANEAAYHLAQSEWLITENPGFIEPEGIEKTYQFSQSIIKEAVDESIQDKMFNLKFEELGPYSIDYTRNGRHLLMGGRKGHVGAFDWKSGNLLCELQLAETVHDVKWLHNETMFAVAQKKYTYIYDSQGLQLHCLSKHIEALKLEFLPYHFLLASVGHAGYLKYQDTSTGKLVNEIGTGLGKCNVMAQNPQNAIIHLGHFNGDVTLWTPSMSKPVVKLWSHKGPVKALAVSGDGNYMVTTGLDSQMKIWDLRKYQIVNEYFTPNPATSISISQTGLIGIGYGPHIGIWKDAFKTKAQSPYMKHLHPSTSIQDIAFCPFEDVLGYGHTNGLSSILIPGSGSAHFNHFDTNPNATKKQRQETEVRLLLEKIQPEMIILNPQELGKVIKFQQEIDLGREQVVEQANGIILPKFKKRGKSSSLRKYLRKQTNVIDGKREALKSKLDKERKEKDIEWKKKKGEFKEIEYSALDRFVKKSN